MSTGPEVDDNPMYGNAFAGPEPRRGRDRGRTIGIVVFAALLAAAAGSVFASGGSARSFFPKAWDPAVEPIATEVATLRGLDFEHPVRITYLAPKDFEKKLAGDEGPTAAERAQIQQGEAVFRALGFISGKADLLKESQKLAASDTLAYYDPASQEVFVRGTTLDVAHRVTIAHELTHALQDQHFDLTKLQDAASNSDATDDSGLTSLIEGDAVRIQREYLKRLSDTEKREYDKENNAEGSRVHGETNAVSDILGVLFGAPYEFGPQAASVLFASGGNAAVDAALTGPPPSSGVFVATGDTTPPVAVQTPALPADGVKLGTSDPFGPFETFLTLAMRVDAVRAVEAADSVGGGRDVTFRSKGETCYRVAIQPRTLGSRAFLLGTFRAWAKGRARSSVETVGDLVQFTACDPGHSAPAPDAQPLGDAVSLLLTRGAVTVSIAEENAPASTARCVGREFVRQPGAEALIFVVGDGSTTKAQDEQIRRMVVDAALECRANADAGLP